MNDGEIGRWGEEETGRKGELENGWFFLNKPGTNNYI
jgi:hypothetical protein